MCRKYLLVKRLIMLNRRKMLHKKPELSILKHVYSFPLRFNISTKKLIPKFSKPSFSSRKSLNCYAEANQYILLLIAINANYNIGGTKNLNIHKLYW